MFTVINVYFNPEWKAADIVDTLTNALWKVDRRENIILAGDLNCRIDKKNEKTVIVLEFLEKEGLLLANEKTMKTYAAFNGSSSIDLTFTRGISVLRQTQLWETDAVLLRKHIPIQTELNIEKAIYKMKEEKRGKKLDVNMLNKNEKIYEIEMCQREIPHKQQQKLQR